MRELLRELMLGRLIAGELSGALALYYLAALLLAGSMLAGWLGAAVGLREWTGTWWVVETGFALLAVGLVVVLLLLPAS